MKQLNTQKLCEIAGGRSPLLSILPAFIMLPVIYYYIKPGTDKEILEPVHCRALEAELKRYKAVYGELTPTPTPQTAA